jgi:protein-disulfide isomerase
MEGRDMEIGGTPTFFIGYSDVANASRIRAIRSINGNAPYREFQKAIAEALEASRDARVEQ